MLQLDDPKAAVHLRTHARARKLTLRVSSVDGTVTLTMPPRLPLAEARAFLARQADWLRPRLDAAPTLIPVTSLTHIPFQGEDLPLRPHSGKRAQFAPGVLLLPQGGGAGPALARLLKARARLALAEASARYAAALGRPYGRITLRDPRGRWGSCSSRGDLMYAWRLILAPPAVLDYVAAHEVAHLAEMNHSPEFWAVVARLMPDYATPRDWLRAHGASLHRFDFS